jgi:hypothetical protein
MEKVFEDFFTELQADMVSICLEYAANKADEIFIHCSCEQGIVTANVFYRINGVVVRRSKLNDALSDEQKKSFQYDVSDARQQGLNRIVNENIRKIEKVCKDNNRPMPTEMKIRYNVSKNSMKADYSYDLLYTNDENKKVSEIFKKWFEEVVQGG